MDIAYGHGRRRVDTVLHDAALPHDVAVCLREPHADAAAGRSAAGGVQEGRSDERPWRRVVFPCAQSALARWLTNDRDTIQVGLRVAKRSVLLTNGHACAQRSETRNSGRTRSEDPWGALPRAFLYRQGAQEHYAVQRVTRPMLKPRHG
jgi:glycine/D-amino acid oxidase-like deaminating enzyme